MHKPLAAANTALAAHDRFIASIKHQAAAIRRSTQAIFLLDQFAAKSLRIRSSEVPLRHQRAGLARAALFDARVARSNAGMATTVEIKTRKRPIIEYLMSPLLRYKQESLRER